MAKRVDLYDSPNANFADQVMAAIRRETYGEDIGQNSWITVKEYDTFYGWLSLIPGEHVLEVASGSGGPALYLARKHGCRVTGIDVNESGIARANQAALASHTLNAYFQLADATQPLPFEDGVFDGLLCMDSANHFQDRPRVLREWQRVLKPGRRVVFTDPVVITGPVSNEELAIRCSTGFFVFVPPEATERFIQQAGFNLLRCDDVTENLELTSGRWHAARQQHQADLVKIEGEERFRGLQSFTAVVHTLTRERRLSRFVYLAEKPLA
jgi:SAM-dependent methyltransferase